uniref:Uncharacterized protein n=1 Tax=Arundo donax TaxID=35708 RepID=A0A0A9CEV6_ARUDO
MRRQARRRVFQVTVSGRGMSARRRRA